MAYTKDGIMAQIFVAFGQGTGSVRVSRGACAALHRRYYGWIGESILAIWESEAVQILERVRTIGRRLAVEAGLDGRGEIGSQGIEAAARGVEEGEDCPFCPFQSEKTGRLYPAAEPAVEEAILGQMLVALGQGTGTVRVSHGACLAFRARYRGWIDGEIVALWGGASVQILERVRAIGRLLAARAGLAGRTAIAAAGVEAAARFVEEVENCPYCPLRQERAQALAAPWREADAEILVS